MKYLKTHNQFLIKESVKEVKAYIEQNKDNMDEKTKELANETLAYLDKWFYKSPNLYFTFFRFVMGGLPLHRSENMSSFDSLEGFLRWAKDNKTTLKSLPKPLIQYDNYEELVDDIKRIDTNSKSKAFYQMLKYLGYEYDENDYKNIAIAYGQLSDKYKRTFESVLKYYKTNKYPIYVFVDKVKEHIENGNRTQQDILKYIKDNNINLIYNKDNIILIQTEQREHIKYLGSPKWCIVYSDSLFNQYLAPEIKSTQYIIFNFNLSVTDPDYRFGITVGYDGEIFDAGQQDNVDDSITSTDIFKVTGIPVKLFTVNLHGFLSKRDFLKYLKDNNIEIIHETPTNIVVKIDDEEQLRGINMWRESARNTLDFECDYVSDIVYENDKCFVCYNRFDAIYTFISKNGVFPMRGDMFKLDMNSFISGLILKNERFFEGYNIPNEILTNIFYNHRKKEDVVGYIKRNNINVVYENDNNIVVSVSDFFEFSRNQLKYFGYVFLVDDFPSKDSFNNRQYRNYYVIINFNLLPSNPNYNFCVVVESDNRISYKKDNMGNDVDLNSISKSTGVPISVFSKNSYIKTKKDVLDYISDNEIEIVYDNRDIIAIEVNEEHRKYLESPYWYVDESGEKATSIIKYGVYNFIVFDFSDRNDDMIKYLIRYPESVRILDGFGRLTNDVRMETVASELYNKLKTN